MRFMEECPYITPCGYCSRTQKMCDKKKQAMPMAAMAERTGKAREEYLKENQMKRMGE